MTTKLTSFYFNILIFSRELLIVTSPAHICAIPGLGLRPVAYVFRLTISQVHGFTWWRRLITIIHALSNIEPHTPAQRIFSIRVGCTRYYKEITIIQKYNNMRKLRNCLIHNLSGWCKCFYHLYQATRKLRMVCRWTVTSCNNNSFKSKLS